mmetsp:Transcript_25798/g.38469  ORF Transcript_25798/g.38469 Transcript_25798/m.38469 type:complete len:404 (-) Transcript_25798:127-1338(-)
MMLSASNNNNSGCNFTVEGNDVLSATEYSKYRQAKALDDIIRATQHLTERERQAVFQLAQNPDMFCPVIRPTPTNNNTFPNLGSNPNATNVMQGVVARLSGFNDRDKVKYHGLIENMGGSFKHELGADHHISHLIISPEEVHASAAYSFLKRKIDDDHVSQVEKEWATRVKIVTPEWVLACWTSNQHVEETQYLAVPPSNSLATETHIQSSPNPSMTTTSIDPTTPSPMTTDTSQLDKVLREFPEEYPNGNTTLYIKKVDGDSSGKKPVIGWAKQCSKKVHRCLGCYVCPHFNEGCCYRHRPQVPRRGKSSSNGIPLPKRDQQCWMHKDAELVLVKCKCKWEIMDHSETLWKVIHTGVHNHPAPPPIRTTHKAKEKMSEIIRQNRHHRHCNNLSGEEQSMKKT